MDRNKLLRIIQRDLNELTELTDELAGKARISDLEIEFALGKSRIVSQEFDYLKELNQQETQDFGRERNILKDHEPAGSEPAFRETEEQAEPGRKVVEFDDLEDEPFGQEPALPDAPDNRPSGTDQSAPAVLQPETMEPEAAKPEPLEPEVPQTETLKPEISKSERLEPEVSGTVSGHPSPAREIPEPVFRESEEEEEEEEIIKHDDHPETESPQKTIAEIFVQEKSLNDILLTGKTIDHKLAATPLTRLESAIGLNDRFLFIRELFASDAGLFNKTIKQIDQMDSLNEAVTFLNKHFKWKKNEASLKFAQLVKRRFSN